MRISWYYCSLLCLAALTLTFWLGAKDYDFVNPPDEKVSGIEAKMTSLSSPFKKEASAKQMIKEEKTKNTAWYESSAQTDETNKETKPPLAKEAEFTTSLNAFRELRNMGAAHYVKMARELYAQGQGGQSVLAWERVLDSSSPNEEQAVLALQQLKAHKILSRPVHLEERIELKLNLIVPDDLWGNAEAAAISTASLIEQGSGYRLKIIPEVSAMMKKRKSSKAPSITAWFSAKSESSQAIFKLKKGVNLEEELQKRIFSVVSTSLYDSTEVSVLPQLPSIASEKDTLLYFVTRLAWLKMAEPLQKS